MFGGLEILNTKPDNVTILRLKQSNKQKTIKLGQANKHGERSMEQTTQNNSSELVILEGQIRECYGRVVYTHKTHEKCSDQRVKEQHRLKLSQIIFSAITTCGLIVVIFGNPEASKVSAILSALFSASLFALNTYTKETDYGALAQKHKQTASKLWDVRESYLSLLTDLKMNCLSCESARNKRDALQKILVEIHFFL